MGLGDTGATVSVSEANPVRRASAASSCTHETDGFVFKTKENDVGLVCSNTCILCNKMTKFRGEITDLSAETGKNERL